MVPGPFNNCATPLASVAALMETEGEGMLHDVETVDDGKRVRCRRYMITFQHQFPPDEFGRARVDDASIARCQSEMHRRFIQFDRACRGNKHTLFVRHGTFCEWHEPWPYIREDKVLSAADVAPVVAAIRERYPQLPFRLCIAYEADLAAVDPAGMPRGVYLHPFHGAGWMGRAPEDMWKGNDAAWDGLFTRMQEETEWV